MFSSIIRDGREKHPSLDERERRVHAFKVCAVCQTVKLRIRTCGVFTELSRAASSLMVLDFYTYILLKRKEGYITH